MGKEFAELGERDGKGGDFELNLELSIGGRYGKTENSKGGNMNFCQGNVNVENNNVSGVSRSEFEDLQRRREIQALRRQEARRKREEKIKKSRGQNGVGFVDDKLFLEAQKRQARVQEREARERDCGCEEKVRKKEKNCSNGVADELSLSLSTDNKMSYPKVQHKNGFQYSCGVFPSWRPNVGEWEKNDNFSLDCDSEHSNGVNNGLRNGKTVSSRSLEQCSSAVSDYQSMSHKGGSSSDTGSHSSSLQPPHQYPSISKNALDYNERYVSCSRAETSQVVRGSNLANPQSTWTKHIKTSTQDSTSLDQTNNTGPSRETSGSLSEKTSNYNAVSIPKMPCVSTTGNGPNGRTITGFLYKYTKMEVSIMCVCHGSSFSPAGFIEHAGGLDTSQPLKHITIVPATLRR